MFKRWSRKVYLCNTFFKQTDNYKAFYGELQRSLERIIYFNELPLNNLNFQNLDGCAVVTAFLGINLWL